VLRLVCLVFLDLVRSCSSQIRPEFTKSVRCYRYVLADRESNIIKLRLLQTCSLLNTSNAPQHQLTHSQPHIAPASQCPPNAVHRTVCPTPIQPRTRALQSRVKPGEEIPPNQTLPRTQSPTSYPRARHRSSSTKHAHPTRLHTPETCLAPRLASCLSKYKPLD